MANMRLHFQKPGMFTTIQDAGRLGYQDFGVPIGGALDRAAMQLANLLVGNAVFEPVLEITLLGPSIQVEGSGQIAITGAHLSPMLNGLPFPMNATVQIANGDFIEFGIAVHGCRAYLSVGGEWRVERWLGSTSPLPSMREALLPNNTIRKGASLKVNTRPFPNTLKIEVETQMKMNFQVMQGPEFDLFAPDVIGHFFSNKFKVSAAANRMGVRLEDSLPGPLPNLEMISSGIVPGTVQVTPSGQVIVLLADAQTTGGYPRIANIISADLDALAQLKPGDTVGFSL